ncbi:MAG: aconitate hydratase AcnA, partial [Holosporales bacterium]
TIANMAPEYGATCGFFPVDQETIRYLEFTGRDAERIALVEAYAKEQGLWRESGSADPVFTDSLYLDLATVEPTLAGPKRPQDRVPLSQAVASCKTSLAAERSATHSADVTRGGESFKMQDGHVVIAAITSCTNTSNPSVMLGAGLVARKALEKGLKVKPWVKTSLAPGSQVVSDYLKQAGLQKDLDQLGFNLVGYGCTTCIGNSGPLPAEIAKAIDEADLSVAAVLSGNRNFEGRVHPQVKLNYLASPMLVVAYALAGSMKIDLYNDPLGHDSEGNPVFLKDIWPTNAEIAACVNANVTPEMFRKRYADVFEGDEHWRALSATSSLTYDWQGDSTYVKLPPYFEGMDTQKRGVSNIEGAKPLAILGDSITTDHISPAGSIKRDGPAGRYLMERGVQPVEFNSYGARRGNHEVMMRGTFANIRLHNEMAPETTGGVTVYLPTGEVMSIFDASMAYQKAGTPLIVIAGKEYGTGSSRDWAAKGTRLLGVKAVIAESFERIHRSNLVGMGVLPLEFTNGDTRHSLALTGSETYSIAGLENGLRPGMILKLHIHRKDNSVDMVNLRCRVDTEDEVAYFNNGGILHYVLRNLGAQAA